jgi:uncharacterized membrane protein
MTVIESFSPNLLSLFAAVLVSVAQTLYRAGLSHLSPTATAFTMNIISAVLAAGLYFYLDDWRREWNWEAFFWFAMVGVFGGAAGRYLNFLAVKLIGLARASILIQSLLIFTSALGILFLGERMTLGVGLGTLAIMFGAAFLVHRPEEGQKKISFWFYLIPVLSAFMFSLTFLFRKYGLAIIPLPPFGMSVAAACGAMILLCAMPFTERRAPQSSQARPLLAVAAGAAVNVVAALMFWTAVREGEIVRVVPINRLSVFFVIFFSWLFFRKQEAVTSRVILGGLLSVAGAFAIVSGG